MRVKIEFRRKIAMSSKDGAYIMYLNVYTVYTSLYTFIHVIGFRTTQKYLQKRSQKTSIPSNDIMQILSKNLQVIFRDMEYFDYIFDYLGKSSPKTKSLFKTNISLTN